MEPMARALKPGRNEWETEIACNNNLFFFFLLTSVILSILQSKSVLIKSSTPLSTVL